MRPFAEAWSSIAAIDGWLTEGQAQMLYQAASRVRPGHAIVEIGSHHGRSTIMLGAGAQPDVPISAVDPFDDPRWGGGQAAMETFRANLAANGLDSIELLRMYGADAGEQWAGPPVGLLFLDGAHDYAGVSADLASWRRHLAEDGTMLLHDAYSSPGVTAAVFRHMFASPDFRYREASRSLVRFDRCEGSRLRSSARMLARVPWFARNLAVKVARRRGWASVERLLGHTDPGLPY